MTDQDTPRTIHGKPISLGLAEGVTCVHRDMFHLVGNGLQYL